MTAPRVAVAIGEEKDQPLDLYASALRFSYMDWCRVEPSKGGRVPVDNRMAVIGLEHVYVLGDVAQCTDAQGKVLPGLVQVAQQQGEHLGKALVAELTKGVPVPPFVFHDRGNAAIVGRYSAVFDFGKRSMTGFFAWLLWAMVHDDGSRGAETMS